MRALSTALVVALSLSASAGAQLPPASVVQTAQERVNKTAQSKAEELADRLRATELGALNPGGEDEVRQWDTAVRLWKKERGAGAAPLLAEGVLFDCLGRLQGVKTPVLSSEKGVPYFADLAAQRPSRAAKSFDAALRIDPSLVEARMRAARIRAPKDAQAARELERLAEDAANSPFSYLAAISRAEAARAKPDLAGALLWYERALAIEPRSAAAAIAIGSLRPGSAIALSDTRTGDLYYSYPCTILTPAVAAGLLTRAKGVVLQ